jgi:hypothetical protein
MEGVFDIHGLNEDGSLSFGGHRACFPHVVNVETIQYNTNIYNGIRAKKDDR